MAEYKAEYKAENKAEKITIWKAHIWANFCEYPENGVVGNKIRNQNITCISKRDRIKASRFVSKDEF